MDQWINLLFEGDYGGSLGGPENTGLIILLSLIVGQFVGWIYMWTHRGLSYSQTFVTSLVVIPVLVAVMMVLMAGSIVVAFGLLAVFAVVRFRNVLKDTRDTSFVLWAITEGLGIGTLRYTTALIAAVGIAAVVVYLRFTDFGSRHRYDAVLNLRLTGEPEAGVAALQGVLRRYSSRVLLTNERRHTDEGVDLSYRLLLRDPRRDGDLKSELDGLDGVEQISLFLRTDESEI
jgi:hypothetical protein